MKMALVVLIPVLTVLFGTAIALALPAGRAGIYNAGPQGFSEVLYGFSSAGNNNGSAFAGLGANNPFYNTALGLAMLVARYMLVVPILAMAGGLAAKKKVPPSAGTLPTHNPLFVGWLIAVFVIVGALSFLPALALAHRATADVGRESFLCPYPQEIQAASLQAEIYRRASGSFRNSTRIEVRNPIMFVSDCSVAPPCVAASAVWSGGGSRRFYRRHFALALVYGPVCKLFRGGGRGARQGAG
jgi:hypothetical protein